MNKKILRDAVELSILYLPLLFISELIEKTYPFDTSVHYNMAFYILPLISAFLCFSILISKNAKTSLKKWILSVPFTFVFYALLYFSNFSVRLTNTIYPGYGRESAGGGFAFMITFFAFSIFQIVGNTLAVGLSRVIGKRSQNLWHIIQDIIIPVICVMILLSVIYLELTMPTLKSIYQSVYS
ncbi:MAG: hypothetical protein Q8873_02990 [Bacillota bacterium]|nr:hypothetical protein [Bacillota bacterium]